MSLLKRKKVELSDEKFEWPEIIIPAIKPPSNVGKYDHVSKIYRHDFGFGMYRNLIIANHHSGTMFLVIGKLLKKIKDDKLYKELDYDSFASFCNDPEIGFSRETAYRYIRLYSFYILELGMAEDDIVKHPPSRLLHIIPQLKDLPKEEAISLSLELLSLTHKDLMLRVRQKKAEDRPKVFFSKEHDMWVVEYFSDKTMLRDHGVFEEHQQL